MPNNNLKHGGKGTRMYICWKHMRSRCNTVTSKDYLNYGGRGIIVCPEWDNFAVFREWSRQNGYADNLTLDRKDNNGNYTPENCRWTTALNQSNNTRRNLIVEAFGERKTVSRWSRDPRCVVAACTLYYRINSGWSGERALITQSRIS